MLFRAEFNLEYGAEVLVTIDDKKAIAQLKIAI